jgi:hypothetical protein
MDPNLQQELNLIKQRLSKLEETSLDSNRILHKMQTSQFVGRLFKFGYLIALVIAGVALYYFLQPFYETLGSIYGIGSNNPSETPTETQGVSPEALQNLSPEDVSGLLKLFNGGQ